jgi:hypothetical protein
MTFADLPSPSDRTFIARRMSPRQHPEDLVNLALEYACTYPNCRVHRRLLGEKANLIDASITIVRTSCGYDEVNFTCKSQLLILR